jgi:hypothetical protein
MVAEVIPFAECFTLRFPCCEPDPGCVQCFADPEEVLEAMREHRRAHHALERELVPA